jgi:hypothetical protein
MGRTATVQALIGVGADLNLQTEEVSGRNLSSWMLSQRFKSYQPLAAVAVQY